MFLQRGSGAAPTWRGVQLQMVPGGQPRRARGPRGGLLQLSSVLDLWVWPRVLPLPASSALHRRGTHAL